MMSRSFNEFFMAFYVVSKTLEFSCPKLAHEFWNSRCVITNSTVFVSRRNAISKLRVMMHLNFK